MRNTQAKQVIIDDILLNYYQTSDNGKAVLFIHGNSMSATQFNHQLNSPLSDEYRLIAIDLPGHGLSGTSQKHDYSLPFYTDIIIKFIDALQLNDVVIVGFSLGGNIIMQTLAREIKLKGALIIATVPLSIPFQQDAFLPNVNTPSFFEDKISMDTIDRIIEENYINSKNDSKNITNAILQTDGKARTDLAKSLFQEFNYLSEVDYLEKNQTPIAFILGSEEPYINNKSLNQQDVNSLWRNKIHLIQGASHLPQLTHISEVNTLTAEFLDDLYE
mgnify:CR=1 FL=1